MSYALVTFPLYNFCGSRFQKLYELSLIGTSVLAFFDFSVVCVCIPLRGNIPLEKINLKISEILNQANKYKLKVNNAERIDQGLRS